MNHKIPCEMIQDILPLYMDKLTSDVTDKELEAHLEECEVCRASKDRLAVEMKAAGKKWKETEQKEIDYLKKVRRSGGKKVLATVLGVIGCIWAVGFLKLFIIGSPQKEYTVLYVNSYEDTVEIAGVCYDSAKVYRDYKLKERKDGTTELIIYTTLPSVFHKSGSFNIVLDYADIGNALNVAGCTVKADGTVIGSRANALFEAKNPYVGDASANGKLLQALGVSNALGRATMELHTKEEPYGCTLHFTESVLNNSLVFEERMQAYACVMIALTDNLSEVYWTYPVELADGAVVRTNGITKEKCSEFLGADIKSFGESPEKVQELLDILGLQ